MTDKADIASAQGTGKKLSEVLGLPTGSPALIEVPSEAKTVYLPGHNNTETVAYDAGPYPALCL